MGCSDTIRKHAQASGSETGSLSFRARESRLSSPSILLAILAAGLLCGCASNRAKDPMAGSYFLDRNKDLLTLGRVALVEMDNISGFQQMSGEITEALHLEIQKQQVFGLVIVHQDDPAWRSLQENLDSLQAMKQLVVLRETLRSNGLLVGTITQYQPYPHMVIGLRLKLVDLTDGQLIWGVEQVWDSTDRAIQKRIQRYYKQQAKSGSSSLNQELTVVSSLNFCKFVAYEVASTLHPPQEP